MSRPAFIATVSGRKAEKPRAMSSAFTNSVQFKYRRSNALAVVLFPAPFGPAMT